MANRLTSPTLSEERRFATSESDVSNAPGVRWLMAEDRDNMKTHRAVSRVVKQLVAQVWRRIPWVARSLIACELQGIYLVYNPEWDGGSHERGRIVLNVADYEDAPLWRASTRVILAHEFAHSLIYYLVASVAGGHTRTGHIPITRKGKPGYEWFLAHTRFLGNEQEEEISRFTERLADALMLAWGFAKDWAHTVDLHEIHNPDNPYSRYLEPDLGMIYHIVQRRLEEERR
jgi:hypothetical protein